MLSYLYLLVILKNNFIYLLAVLSLHCCVGFTLVAERMAYPSRSAWAIIPMASPVAKQTIGHAGFSSCGFWAVEHNLSSCGTQT